MLPANVYMERRERLRRAVQAGLILLLGHDDSPMNYGDNPYPFRQDSSFLYYCGLDSPGLAAVLDVQEGTETLFGDEPTIDDLIWKGPQASLKERCEQVGIHESAPRGQLEERLKKALDQARRIHFLPQYRPDNVLRLKQLLGIDAAAIPPCVSEPLIKAVVAQRSVKSVEEIRQIEMALDITYEMHTLAMKTSRPEMYEREIAGAIEGLALSREARLAFPTIFSRQGQILHNHLHGNVLKEGDLVVHDSGAESPLHYASDITRTIAIGGRFTERQRELYQIVLRAQEQAIDAIRPGIEFRDVHRTACVILACDLIDLGLMKGNPEEAVQAGAHTLFFPCGLGHMMGLDVHDMEGIGEDYVGYTDSIRRRPEFGWRSLRLAKALKPGFVVTVEPGVYFIPELIDRWKAERKWLQFINYDLVLNYRDFGGVRIEDDVLVLEDGHRVLGKRIPKTIEEVEDMSAC